MNGSARLFDFELAGYRHALLDVAYLHLGFQWCYQPGRIPPDVLGEAETAYRLEASSGIPMALDQAAYQRGLTAAAAAWAARQIATLHEYAAMSDSASVYPALSQWISELVNAFEREELTGHRRLYRSFDRQAGFKK